MYPAYIHGWVCIILGVAGASVVVCMVLFTITVKAGVSGLLNRSPVCWFLVANVLITVVLDKCV